MATRFDDASRRAADSGGDSKVAVAWLRTHRAELATLKARLTDAVASQIGEMGMRQLLITDLVSQPL